MDRKCVFDPAFAWVYCLVDEADGEVLLRTLINAEKVSQEAFICSLDEASKRRNVLIAERFKFGPKKTTKALWFSAIKLMMLQGLFPARWEAGDDWELFRGKEVPGIYCQFGVRVRDSYWFVNAKTDSPTSEILNLCAD